MTQEAAAGRCRAVGRHWTGNVPADQPRRCKSTRFEPLDVKSCVNRNHGLF